MCAGGGGGHEDLVLLFGRGNPEEAPNELAGVELAPEQERHFHVLAGLVREDFAADLGRNGVLGFVGSQWSRLGRLRRLLLFWGRLGHVEDYGGMRRGMATLRMFDLGRWGVAIWFASNEAGRTMSKIEINSFSGIRPVISADKLAGIEAQTANNCKVRSKSLVPLNGDLPSVPTYAFSYVDGFGTWTHATDGALKLGGSAVNQSAPSVPGVSILNAFTSVSLSWSVQVTLDDDTTKTVFPVQNEIDYTETGRSVSGSYESHPVFIREMESLDRTNGIKAFNRVIAVTIGASSLTEVGQTAELSYAGTSIGRARLTMLTSTPSSAGWSWDKEAGKYFIRVAPFKVSFALSIEYTSSLGSERAVVYRVTNVESSGIETPASVQTPIVTLTPKQYAQLTGMTGGKKKRIYRAAGTELNSEYYFVAEVSSGATTYSDFIADADLGEVMPDIENPPSTLAQVVLMPGGFLAGFNGKDIYFSDPFMLYSWNSDYTLTTQENIVGLGVSGNDLTVLTTRRSYLVSGSTPDVLTMSELMVPQACISRLSICTVGSLVGFASSDGFILIQGGVGRNVLEPYYSRSQWIALLPVDRTTIAAVEYDNKIVIFLSASSGIILDYLHDHLVTFSGGGTGSFTWKSKIFESDLPIEMHVVKVSGESGTHAVTLFADGSSVASISVAANTDAIVPIGTTSGKSWEIQIVGAVQVDSIGIIHRDRIAVTGPIRMTQSQTEGSWRRLLFYFQNRGRFDVVRCRAHAYDVTADFYRDATLDVTKTISNDTDLRIVSTADNDLWEVDLTSSKEIYEMVLVPRQVEKVSDAVIHLKNDGVQGLITMLARTVEFPREDYFACVRVRATAYPVTLRLYRNGDKNALTSITATDDNGRWLPKFQPARIWEIDAVASTGVIHSVSLAKSMSGLRI